MCGALRDKHLKYNDDFETDNILGHAEIMMAELKLFIRNGVYFRRNAKKTAFSLWYLL